MSILKSLAPVTPEQLFIASVLCFVAKVEGISFADNAEILLLIEGKGGLLPMLDDATTGLKQTDVLYAGNAAKAAFCS